MTTETAGDAGTRFVTSQTQARLDRGCDRCGAKFVDIAIMPDGGQLQFCGHHCEEHFLALNRAGARWLYGYVPIGARS